jgi:hypothetical protein
MEGPAAERIVNTYMQGGSPQQPPPKEFGIVTIKQ